MAPLSLLVFILVLVHMFVRVRGDGPLWAWGLGWRTNTCRTTRTRTNTWGPVLVPGAFLLAQAASATIARAQETAPDLYVVSAPSEAEVAALEERAVGWLRMRGEHAEPLAVSAPGASAGILPDRLEVLVRVEAAVRHARDLYARFEERAALRVLGEARETLLAALEVPHAHAWLAEIELAVGLCAVQRGEEGLAEAALMRAASLDPTRRLQAGEAPPAALRLAQLVEHRRESTPPSQVRVEVEPTGAQLWLDGRDFGATPRELAVPSGAHVLTVQAPGHRPYTRLVELLPGRRLPIRIQLAPLPELDARHALARAGDDRLRRQEAAIALHRATGRAVWLFSASEPRLAQAVHCTATCHPVRAPDLTPREPPQGIASAAHAERPFWRRWPVWVVSSAVLASGLAVGLLVGREESVRRERELTLDPGQLPR